MVGVKGRKGSIHPMTPLVYARIGISLSAAKRFIHEILLYPWDSPSRALRRL